MPDFTTVRPMLSDRQDLEGWFSNRNCKMRKRPRIRGCTIDCEDRHIAEQRRSTLALLSRDEPMDGKSRTSLMMLGVGVWQRVDPSCFLLLGRESGVRDARCGLRGTRVGEASYPGHRSDVRTSRRVSPYRRQGSSRGRIANLHCSHIQQGGAACGVWGVSSVSLCCPVMSTTNGRENVVDMDVFDMTRDGSHGEDTPQAGPADVLSMPHRGGLQLHWVYQPAMRDAVSAQKSQGAIRVALQEVMRVRELNCGSKVSKVVPSSSKDALVSSLPKKQLEDPLRLFHSGHWSELWASRCPTKQRPTKSHPGCMRLAAPSSSSTHPPQRCLGGALV